jgi:hypothetical protein
MMNNKRIERLDGSDGKRREQTGRVCKSEQKIKGRKVKVKVKVKQSHYRP